MEENDITSVNVSANVPASVPVSACQSKEICETLISSILVVNKYFVNNIKL